MNHYHLDFHGHHDALNDAKACAMITYRLLKHYDDLQSMLSIYGKISKIKADCPLNCVHQPFK